MQTINELLDKLKGIVRRDFAAGRFAKVEAFVHRLEPKPRLQAVLTYLPPFLGHYLSARFVTANHWEWCQGYVARHEGPTVPEILRRGGLEGRLEQTVTALVQDLQAWQEERDLAWLREREKAWADGEGGM